MLKVLKYFKLSKITVKKRLLLTPKQYFNKLKHCIEVQKMHHRFLPLGFSAALAPVIGPWNYERHSVSIQLVPNFIETRSPSIILAPLKRT